MTRLARVSSASLILLVAVAAGQDRRPPQTTLLVPAGKAPVMDGRVDAEEWAGAARFELQSGDGVPGKGWMRRVGRELYVGIVSEMPAVALGLRLNFADPVSGRVIPVLVTPINPPRAPLEAFRKTHDGTPERVSCQRCDVRFDFSQPQGFSLELRLPLELLEFTRSKNAYGFTAELWN